MSLSDEEVRADNKKKDNGFYWSKDVREFIKEIENKCNACLNAGIEETEELRGYRNAIRDILELMRENAGEKLI